MSKILVLTQQEPITLDGDLYNDKLYKFVRNVVPNELDNLKPLMLKYLAGYHLWRNLLSNPLFDKYNMNDVIDSTEYKCWIANTYSKSVIPITIFSDNIEKYFPHDSDYYHFKEIACDVSWNTGNNGVPIKDYYETNCYSDDSIDKQVIGKIQQAILGSGYREECIPSDGSAVLQPLIMDLSNGDKMYCLGYVWYNK